jgi:aspartate/methionine/tyrosine aminotransferase
MHTTANSRGGGSPLDELDISSAPGQENPLSPVLTDRAGEEMDFSHGDVEAFPPIPGAFDRYQRAYADGRRFAYSRYRGHVEIREHVALHVGDFTGQRVDPATEIIVTPGTQGALFLALSSLVAPGDKVAIVAPDYFANSRIVAYLRAQPISVTLNYEDAASPAEIDLDSLESAFAAGAKVFVFSNPNNPTGVVYSAEQTRGIVALAAEHGAFVVVDQLYSRLIYGATEFTHLRSSGIGTDRCMTLLGPSKTESLSGFRVGVAVGAPEVIDRMEKLQALVSLRAAGYSQAVLKTWFAEPEGWLDERIQQHQLIRDDLLAIFAASGFAVRSPAGGSYMFPNLPQMSVSAEEFRTTLRVEHGITVTPGAEFGAGYEHSIRLNFSQQRDKAVEAVSALCGLATKLTR